MYTNVPFFCFRHRYDIGYRHLQIKVMHFLQLGKIITYFVSILLYLLISKTLRLQVTPVGGQIFYIFSYIHTLYKSIQYQEVIFSSLT